MGERSRGSDLSCVARGVDEEEGKDELLLRMREERR